VIVSQLLRSPGIYFTVDEDSTTGRKLGKANLVPSRGAWLEFDTSSRDVISVKVDGKRKIPVTTILRSIGYGSDKELLNIFEREDNSSTRHFIQSTLDKDPLVRNEEDALIDIYRKLRPGDPPNVDNARKLITNLFFNPQHYDLGIVGRYKLNQRLNIPKKDDDDDRALTREDLIEIIRHIIMVSNGDETPDDIDHLGNRRVRTVGELIQNQFRVGLVRLERVAKERMSIISNDVVTPGALVNIRPVLSAIREFFSGSQLSQFMDQTNPLAELTHKRRLSAMGPGGLSRDRAGFDVRDVHYSHYGRICPIETPEGPNIGLIGTLAAYGRINRYGFIETSYRKVVKELANTDKYMAGKIAGEDILGDKNQVVIKAFAEITKQAAAELSKLSARNIPVKPYVSKEIEYLQADKEDKYNIAQANTVIDENGYFVNKRIEVRYEDRYLMLPPEKIDYMDVSTKQIFSVAASLIPFLEHNDANRALMGANMQRQAVPLLCAESPIVATGMEREVARYSGQVLFAKNAGTVISVTSTQIVVRTDGGQEDNYLLQKFIRTNQGTCINQNPIVSRGQKVEKAMCWQTVPLPKMANWR
jgi:DNA-directed RNA polymerase subunit beta